MKEKELSRKNFMGDDEGGETQDDYSNDNDHNDNDENNNDNDDDLTIL